jgi:MFS family permease
VIKQVNTQLKTVRVLAFAQVLSGIGVAGMVAAGSLLVSSISGSEILAGLAQTSAVLGAAAMALPLAKLTQIGGRNLALSSGYLFGSLGAIFAIIGGSLKYLPILLFGTFLLGAASAAGYQARFAATDLASNEKRASQLSIVVWGSTIGAVTGPNLMGPSGNIALTLGLPQLVGPYLIAASTLILATLLIYIFLRPDPYLLSVELAQKKNTPTSKNSTKEVLRLIRNSNQALFSLAAIVIGHIAMVSVMVMTPVHMAHVDVRLVIIGFVISVHVAGMYAFSPLVGYLSDKLGRVNVIQIGIVILLISAITSGLSEPDNSVELGTGLFLLGLGWSCTLIAGSTLLTESVPVDRKVATQGASDLVMNIGGALGGALAGVIIAILSYGWLCAVSAFPVLILGFWSMKIKKKNLQN